MSGFDRTEAIAVRPRWFSCCAAVASLCAAPLVAAQTLPQTCRSLAGAAVADVALCERRFGTRALASADAKTRSELTARLRSRADADIRSGDFESARAALDCANAHARRGDWRDRYETLRRYGVLEYRSEHIDRALVGFECALQIAERHEDRDAIAKQSKNVGAALLRLGDYSGAQAALERSVSIQRAGEDSQIGAALNNLGDLYREKKDIEKALRYYQEALDAYRRHGDDIEAAHTMETISVIELDRGDRAAATMLLGKALDTYRIRDQGPYRLRVYAGLVRAALLEGDTRQARRWSADGLAFAAEHKLTVPAPLNLQTARIDRAEGRSRDAVVRLRAAMANLPAGDPDRIALLEEFGLALADVGEYPQAIAALRDANRLERGDLRARFDRQTGWQRSRFEASERERRIARLEHENLQRRLWLWLVSVSALALLLSAWLWATRRLQRARVLEAERRVRELEIMERYRREVEALQIDRRLLRAMLATHDDALCLLDAEGAVLAASPKACALLGRDENDVLGNGFSARLRERDRPDWFEMLDSLDETGRAGMRLETSEGLALIAEIAQWEQDGGVLSLRLRPAIQDRSSVVAAAERQRTGDGSTAVSLALDSGVARLAVATASQKYSENAALAATLPADDDAAHEGGGHADEMSSATAAAVPFTRQADEGQSRERYRRELVELMLAAIEAWERTTTTSRLELAERSRIWRVNVDDGRLRARVMERYLALSKLPQNPRWRDVLRTAYFVLSNAGLAAAERDALQARIDGILAYRRRSALA
jgi:PAS domain S-box-containing protein